ncbi:MAG TPA: hypothetical protein VNA27_15810 [Rubrobacteraceae bacterium]|nr:hypothetical protein [Rubrobacteraceae bacterium]
MRALVEEQNRRISELEEAVRTGRELEPPQGEPVQPDQPTPAEETDPGQDQGDTSPWRRVLAWFGFGFGGPRP